MIQKIKKIKLNISQECKESKDAYRLLVVELIKNEFEEEKEE